MGIEVAAFRLVAQWLRSRCLSACSAVAQPPASPRGSTPFVL